MFVPPPSNPAPAIAPTTVVRVVAESMSVGGTIVATLVPNETTVISTEESVGTTAVSEFPRPVRIVFQFVLPTNSLQNRTRQESQQRDEYQSLNPLVSADKEWAYEQWSLDRAKAFFHAILAFEKA